MKTNEDLQKDVQNAIKWEPLLHAAEIGVTVNNGIVTLTGEVDHYSKKVEAEKAAKGVAGVTAVVEKIMLEYPSRFATTDNEIAANALKALNDSWNVPNDKVKVIVEGGHVTLEGDLAWNYQKEAAKNAVAYLAGVKRVDNNIHIQSESHNEVEKRQVEKALERNWSLNAEDIHVAASGTKITLTGSVSSLYDKEEAGRIAWNTPGVWSVENELIVEYDYSVVD